MLFTTYPVTIRFGRPGRIEERHPVKVTFRNLGPIEEATLDLSKRLTVLVGKNNTGKTFLASAAYAVHHARTSKVARREILRPIVNSALASGTGDINLRALREAWFSFCAAWGTDVSESIPRCLGLSRTASTTVAIDAVLEIAPTSMKTFRFDETVFAVSTGTGSEHIRIRSLPLDLKVQSLEALVLGGDVPEPAIPAMANDELLDTIVSILCERDWVSQPAERLGIHVFARELSASRFSAVDEMLESGGASRALGNARAYPWPVRDALVGDLQSSRREPDRSEPDLLVQGLESLLGGKIAVSDKREFEFTLASGETLSTNEVSSSVKSLAGLVLQLPNAKFRSHLLLDEPEMSLHPDLQRKFARWLGRAVGEGQQFLIATHSDYIVRELSHLLMMHNASPAMRKVMEENGYTPKEAIDPAHIEVLRLGEGRATPIEVDRHGFRVDTIDDELERISALSQDLFAVLDEPVEDASGE